MGYGNGGSAQVQAQSQNAEYLKVMGAPTRAGLEGEFGNHQQRIVELHHALSELEKHLESVCTPQGPEGTAGQIQSAPEPIRSQAMSALRSAGVEITRATDRIRTLLSRLEV